MLALGAVGDAWARPPTDVVKLNNGDRLTGESKKLDRGILTFKTDALDTVSVEWETVVEIVSDFAFEFRGLDGTLYFGTLAKPSKPGNILIVTPTGPVELPMREITQLLPVESKFWEKLDGDLAVGFDTSSASDVTRFSSDFKATYRTHRWESSLGLSVIINDQDPESTSRENLSYSSFRIWNKRRFTGALIQGESNEELELDYRLLIGGIAGRDLIESPHSRFRLAGGIAVNQEKREGSEDTTQNTEGILALTYDLFVFSDPETDLSVSSLFYPSLSETGRLRAEMSVALTHEITKDFDWVLEAYDTYESDPPTADASQHDWGVYLSLAWDF